jgi:hypothetical protein
MGKIKDARLAALELRAADAAAARLTAQIFRREGEYWTIVYAGTIVRLRDAIGFRYLVQLLAHPNQPFAVGELAAAVKGSSPGDAERARSAVGKRIRDAVRRIEDHHPALGYHLRAGIKTGARCAYVPSPEHPLTWVT